VRIATLLGVAVLLTAGCGGSEREAAHDGDTVVVTRSGRVHGVGIGDPPSRITRRFGSSLLGHGFLPVDAQLFTGPQAIPGAGDVYRYRGVAFLADDEAVYALTTTVSGAVTEEGVGVGDDLGTIRHAYPNARCGAYDYGDSGYSWCRVRLGANTVFFGGDPIRSITVTWATR